METVIRKDFTNTLDEIAAQRAELFISQQENGARTWKDGAEVAIHQSVRGGSLQIVDKMNTDHGGPLRHIELRRNGRVIVTFVYSHFSGQLRRTF